MDISSGADRSCNSWYSDSFLTAAHITCTRRAHQVTACVLYQALEEAHQEYVISTEPGIEAMSLEDWCNKQSNLPMFKFWFTVLQLELTLLVFLQSIRTGDFKLYVKSLTKFVPWFFSLDHFNYSRWISVHLRDMVTLSHLHPQIYEEFRKGHFTVQKTNHSFSKIALRRHVSPQNAVPQNWGEFFRLADNKKELFSFLSREVVTIHTEKQVISTFLEDVICQERNTCSLFTRGSRQPYHAPCCR